LGTWALGYLDPWALVHLGSCALVHLGRCWAAARSCALGPLGSWAVLGLLGRPLALGTPLGPWALGPPLGSWAALGHLGSWALLGPLGSWALGLLGSCALVSWPHCSRFNQPCHRGAHVKHTDCTSLPSLPIDA
jgi:hypothetical protein